MLTYVFYAINESKFGHNVVSEVSAFQPGDLDSIPGGIRFLIPILGLGVSFVCVLPCVYSGDSPDHTFGEACPCPSVQCSGPKSVAPPKASDGLIHKHLGCKSRVV